ncbi:Putative mycofactocin radical SAM maturase MftC [Fundidesulfovibrio magnetotacticus]|uniref:Mycofactocin radical SAM maturase MftC n=1 Tax=Fundidesulfovibrio magnetotacticus TaxID=2730080 RepID=A0A6V8LV91_9BACT|nr:radical SAM protein [Fundidesulfovibrio magnetotacticus]GFK94870.1 Putative mycofactocin radical SAM maturase MftC [Fundidesulfovibrio magnetotacticus]
MRRKHLDVLKKRLLALDLPWFADQARKLLGVPASYYLRRPLCPPVFGGMVVTYRCNETCPMCNVRKKADPSREMDTPAMLDLAGQMADLGVSGVSITGGEPLVRADVFEIVERLKNRGVPVSMSTNGVRLADPVTARALVECGIDSVAVSLDGDTPEEHDRSRGRKGAFEKTLQGVRNLLEARNARPGARPLLVTLAVVLSRANAARFENILTLAKSLGVDNVSLNPLHDTFQGEPTEDPGLYFAPDDADLDALPDRLLELRARHGLMDSSRAYISHLGRFFRTGTMPGRCYAPYFSLYVDCHGDILPCGGHFYENRIAFNLQGRTLAQAWRSPEMQAVRDRLRNCRACYYSCMAELNLTYARFP